MLIEILLRLYVLLDLYSYSDFRCDGGELSENGKYTAE